MDSVDPRFSFEMVDHPSDAAPGSMVREIHVEDGWAQTHVQKRDIISGNQHLNIESEFRQNQVLTNQNPDSMNENVAVALAGPVDQSSYFEAVSAVSTEPILKQARYNPEAFQRGGIHRRLQFEDPSNTVINRPAQSPSNSGGPESPFETPCTPIKGKETEKIEPLYPRTMNNTLNLPKPSGIGLHLNSIVNVLPSGSGAVVHVKSAQNCNFTIRGKKSTHTINSHLSDMSVFTPVENVSECMDDNEPEIHASKAVIKSSNNSVDDQTAQGNKRAYTEIENDVNSDEFKSNAEKRRKRSSDPSGGCKRCHCKKSKCLKLYCDCFAAGLYCAGSCACQGCYNRPEYENIVLESRQQIESRNPLAFAPKIVKDIVEPPATASSYEVIESSFTPSPARHKRGCNCKKSMCLKKYCECYHSNVGCSDGCRCEGCKNVYGQKAESGFDKDLLSKEGNGGLVHSKLTPPTPAIQLFKKDVQDFQSPKNSGGIISETVTEVVDLTSSDQELYYDTAQTPNEYSNRYLKAVDLDGELSNTTQDDTPDILKESYAVKSSSPNKKRVSPPHASRHEIGLRSLNGLKTGRKFILKAVPSIPPLTPSVDSRRSVHQETDGPPRRLLPK